MAIILPKKGKTYRYEFTVNGEKFTGSTGVQARGAEDSKEREASRTQAQKVEAALKAEKQADARKNARRLEAKQTLGIVNDKGDTVIPTILEAVSAYWENVGKKATNAKDDEKHFEWIVDQIGPDTLVTDVRNKTVQMVVNRRTEMPKLSKPRRCRKTGAMLPGVRQVIDFETGEARAFEEGKDDERHIIRLQPSSVNRTSIDVLKRVILYARDTLEVPGMPGIKWADYRLSEPKPRTRTLTHAEEARIEEHLREGYGAAFRFAIKSGFRLSNFTEAFTWDQVDFVTRKITIRQKGNREHTIIMTAEIEAILREQVGRDPKHVFVFVYKGRGKNPKPWTNPRNGKTYVPGARYPVTYWGFDSWFDDVKAETGITDLRNHDLRRTAASRVIRAIGNVEAARHLLGHRSESMTLKVYNQLSEEEAFADLNVADRIIAERRAREVPVKATPQNAPENSKK